MLPFTSIRYRFAAVLSVGFAISLSLTGCGGGPKPSEKPAAANSQASSNAAPTKSAQAESGVKTSDKPGAPNEVRIDSSGKKWVGPIPYDVFFEDPLAVASNKNAVAAAAPSSDAAVKPEEKPAESTAAADKPAAGGGSDWATLLPIKIAEAEVKKIRNHLTESLQSVGKYNGNYKDIQTDGAVLAGIGGIVTEHSENISWKANAKYVRDLGAKIESSSQELGGKSHKASQEAFDQLTAVLDGNKPADLAEADDKAPFNERADRAGLMKRMDRAFNWAKKNVTTEALFKSSADEVTHESAILATFAKVIALPGYPSADEDQYKKHAQSLIDACKDMEKAVHTQDFKLYNDALSKVQKKCDECHTDYRFAE